MTTITAQETAVAAAFADNLPTAAPTKVRPAKSNGDTAGAVVVSVIGDTSADIAAVIVDEKALADGLDNATLAERLQDAFDAAGNALGVGAVAEATATDAAAIFADSSAQVFELIGDKSRVIGRLAVRITRAAQPGAAKLKRIAGVQMDMTVEIGNTRLTVAEILALEPGRVIELDRSAGSPADIKVNGKLVAHGEIVVQDQDYAVRVTRIVDAAEV